MAKRAIFPGASRFLSLKPEALKTQPFLRSRMAVNQCQGLIISMVLAVKSLNSRNFGQKRCHYEIQINHLFGGLIQ